MGLSESSLSTILKPFECFSHCKVTARSPCCKWCCGEESGSCSVDTRQYSEHEYVVT